jgi:hypothetical protein
MCPYINICIRNGQSNPYTKENSYTAITSCIFELLGEGILALRRLFPHPTRIKKLLRKHDMGEGGKNERYVKFPCRAFPSIPFPNIASKITTA